MDSTVITTALTGLVTDFTGLLTSSTPTILLAVGAMAGLTIGVKVFKRLISKVG